MQDVTLEQLEAYDAWLDDLATGAHSEAELTDWLSKQENGQSIPQAYIDMFF